MRYLSFSDLKNPAPEDRRPALPFSKQHVKRMIAQGHFPKPVKFGGPKSKDFWPDEVIDRYFADLNRSAV
jgi:hypothetical protein